ncbi:MAG: hypothetical protein ACK4RK_03610 [Gemmataceae bacterium]
MPLYAILFGLLLTGVGAWGYFGSDARSVTALIPAFVGVPLVLLGVLGFMEKLRKHVMHAAAALALLGFLAAAGRLLANVFTGKEVFTFAGGMIALMALLCLIFEGMCIKSFIDARRARKATEG